jgi:23S rRNA (guanosine2251-2'-O)-methyltransferase
MSPIVFRLILSDLRGAGNVGSIMRTANACGVELIYACGYTPYPRLTGDDRPPHIITSNTRSIAKTALGAELTMPVRHFADTSDAILEAKHDGFDIIVIEQAETSLNLFSFIPTNPKLALVLGNEVEGITRSVCELATAILELPMIGTKESLNVSSAAAVALYHLRFGRLA